VDLFLNSDSHNTGTATGLSNRQEPSDWVRRWTHLVRQGGSVLDVACGHGRHMCWFAQRGYSVTGIDHNWQALEAASVFGRVIEADLVSGPWPLMHQGQPQQFSAVVVTNYLWRALLPTIVLSVEPGGVLLYETFSEGNGQFGKPSRPDYLLNRGELLAVCQGWNIIAYENGLMYHPPRMVQRIAAQRRTSNATSPQLSLSLE
jgi:SAM-dependent methyltransferase